MRDGLTDLHSQASEEAKASGERVNVALQEPCVHGLTDRHGSTTNKWDCWGCTREVVAAEVDRVSRERTRQALERAAKLCEKNRGREGWIAMAAAIRGLSDGDSVASEEKEE